MKNITALVLCAGLGTRLRPLTYFTPKALIKVGGRAVIDYIFDNLEKCGVKRVFINLHHLGEKIMKHVGGRALYSYEPRLLGTAGAIIPVFEFLSDPFLVINGDTITNVDLTGIVKFHLWSKRALTVFSKDTAVHNGGVYVVSKGLIREAVKQNAGAGFSLHENLIPIMEKKQIGICDQPDIHYFDIGTFSGLKRAKDFYEKKSGVMP